MSKTFIANHHRSRARRPFPPGRRHLCQAGRDIWRGRGRPGPRAPHLRAAPVHGTKSAPQAATPSESSTCCRCKTITCNPPMDKSGYRDICHDCTWPRGAATAERRPPDHVSRGRRHYPRRARTATTTRFAWRCCATPSRTLPARSMARTVGWRTARCHGNEAHAAPPGQGTAVAQGGGAAVILILPAVGSRHAC